jgi:predicted TIM-barrel fold metal-dependent hydrolase
LEASHLGLPESVIDVCFDTTRTAVSLLVNGVLKRYPNVRFILAHAGGAVPYMAGRLSVTFSLFETVGGVTGYVATGVGKMASVFPRLKDRMPATLDIFLKVKENVLPEGPDYYLQKLYYDTALSASPHVFASLLALVDSTRVVFGTDYVFATEAAVAPTIRGIDEYQGFT